MSPATLKLHTALIRLAKGMLSAWQDWLTDQQAAPSARTSSTSS
jgi:hypothetical protein